MTSSDIDYEEKAQVPCPLCGSCAEKWPFCQHLVIILLEWMPDRLPGIPLCTPGEETGCEDMIQEGLNDLYARIKKRYRLSGKGAPDPDLPEGLRNLLGSILECHDEWQRDLYEDPFAQFEGECSHDVHKYVVDVHARAGGIPFKNTIADRPGLSWETFYLWAEDPYETVDRMTKIMRDDAEKLLT